MAITYTPATNFGAKDTLPTNDPGKVIKGAEFTTEFNAIQTAFGFAAPAASPALTGTVSLNGTSVDAILDEDNMASDSDTALATQQSIKAYVDSAVGSPTVDLTPSVDNSLDLGSASKRWQDLYLSGGIYIGGTTSANYLEDYEKGTFTLNVPGSYLLDLSGTPSSYYAEYVKIGRTVHVFGQIIGTSLSINSGGYIIFGTGALPFATTTQGSSPVGNDTFTGVVGDGAGYGLTTAGSRIAAVGAVYGTDWSWGPTSFTSNVINAVCTYMTDS